MDKKKIVGKAREKLPQEKAESSGQKSLLGDILDTVMDIVGDSKDDSDESQSAREGDRGKTSGRKPRAQNNGKVATVGRSVADQLRQKK